MDTDSAVDQDKAVQQFNNLVRLLENCGVDVQVFPGDPRTPEAVFPNNVFSTIPGSLIIGSMAHEVRQIEADRSDIRSFFSDTGNAVTDLRSRDCVAELTGSMIIDRARRIGFCGMSSRVNDKGLAAMHEAFKLRLTLRFDLDPAEYHTNVIMSVLAGRACVIQPDALVKPSVADTIAECYPGKTLFIDQQEKDSFAGNCIALTPHDLFMSARGADALKPSSRATLESWGFELRTVNLDEIEKAGGSLRCMIGEVY